MPVEEINSKVPFGKRIHTINCSDWENYGIKISPLQDKIPKFTGYPHIFLDINNVTNILSKDQIRAFLEGYFEKDKIIE